MCRTTRYVENVYYIYILAEQLSQVHKLCQASAEKILSEFHPSLMIAIGGGGYVPARILRYAHLYSAPLLILIQTDPS